MQDLRPNSQDTSAFYLEKMYQLQADPNASLPSTPSSLVSPPAFSPPRYAVWVNILWFLSLVISLTCAMLATSLQQWARRYIRITRVPRRSPEKRARMHAFFANGVDKFQISWAVEALPALVHLSLFIFFAGLLVFLFHINHSVFGAVVCWVALSSAAYACITLMPIFSHDSPYSAPLSSTVWFLYAAIPYGLFRVLEFVAYKCTRYSSWFRFRALRRRYHAWVLGGFEKAAEEIASKRSPELDSRILEWTVEALSEDEELEKFFESIPGFYASDVVKNLQGRLPQEVQKKTEAISSSFLKHTLSSSSVSESVGRRRLATCLNAAAVIGGPLRVAGILRRVLQEDWSKVPYAVEIGHFLRQWDVDNGEMVSFEIRSIVGRIVSGVLKHDDRWMALVLNHLGIPECILQRYLEHGDSALLANLNRLLHVIRQLTRPDWAPISALFSMTRFDIQDTLPELQHEFCILWNAFVVEARKSGTYSQSVKVLWATRFIYISLHRDTDAFPTAFSDSTFHHAEILFRPSSYPSCNIPGHLTKLVSHIHDQATGETPHVGATTPDTVPHCDPLLTNIAPPTVPDVTSFKLLTSTSPPHVEEKNHH